MKRLLLGLCLASGVYGCEAADNNDAQGTDPAAGSWKPETNLLTDTETLEPTKDPLSTADSRSPLVPADRQAMIDDGFGNWKDADGEAPLLYSIDDEEQPARGKNARRLARFAHLADLQLADDESPGRAVNLDQAGPLGGAFRPQESDLCRMINAMVKTLNNVNTKTPLSFVLLGGDNADNAQQNEVDWTLQILGGQDKVECDSGDDDDLVPGPDNDGKDPFAAPGLDVPFYWVTGNHDVEAQGTAAITTPLYQEAVVGTKPLPGYKLRDFSQPGGPASDGPVPADPNRKFLERKELMQRVQEHGDGHGLSTEQVDSGKAIYTFDVANSPLRFLVIDTAAETGGAEGVIHQADVDAYIKPALDKAADDGKWVIVTSHHASRALSDGSGFFGKKQDDALTKQAWIDLLGGYPNVIFALAAHDHADHVEQQNPTSGQAYWELTTSALADYPHQARIIELWDEDNGYVSLQAIYVDLDMDDEAVAEAGRHLGVMDYVSGWNTFFALGKTSKRNAILYMKKP